MPGPASQPAPVDILVLTPMDLGIPQFKKPPVMNGIINRDYTFGLQVLRYNWLITGKGHWGKPNRIPSVWGDILALGYQPPDFKSETIDQPTSKGIWAATGLAEFGTSTELPTHWRIRKVRQPLLSTVDMLMFKICIYGDIYQPLYKIGHGLMVWVFGGSSHLVSG